MKKVCLLSIILGVTSVANASWWDQDNNFYKGVASNSQVYTQEDEDLAYAMAISASLHDLETKKSTSVLPEIKKASAVRTNGVRNSSKISTNLWMHNTYTTEGPNNAYALVATQRKLNEVYYNFEQQNGTMAAQNRVMKDSNLNEHDLLDYVLQLSLLNR